jgi:hypothetical protein
MMTAFSAASLPQATLRDVRGKPCLEISDITATLHNIAIPKNIICGKVPALMGSQREAGKEPALKAINKAPRAMIR